MKKKSLKTLKLKKEVISNLEYSKIQGGSAFPSYTCTFGEICRATGDLIDGLIDGLNSDANNC